MDSAADPSRSDFSATSPNSVSASFILVAPRLVWLAVRLAKLLVRLAILSFRIIELAEALIR